MAFSRRFADSDRVVAAIFEDDFGLSDEEVSESDNGNDVYGYLGHSIISRSELIDKARDLVQEDAFEAEDEPSGDVLLLSFDNSTIHDMFQDVSSNSEEDMAVDNGDEDSTVVDNIHDSEESEGESLESNKPTTREESVSSAESEVSDDITSYKLVINST